jgi:tRNA pseudouridine13 synthase
VTGPKAPRPEAVLRREPDDFVVEEIPAYEPSGEGEHVFITFRKSGLTTLEALRRMARALEVDPREAGFAGMKDRHAVTTQTGSLPWRADRSLDAIEQLSIEGIEVLAFRRHPHKLKTGHLRANRFVLRLRDVDPDARPQVDAALGEIALRGVPNAFGSQRFGREGDNARVALDWLTGRARGPRGKREQRLLFSALQSRLFNEVLARREEQGSWDGVLAGDLAQKHDSGGMFEVPLEGDELEDARVRAAEGRLSATGPMFGAKMRWPAGEPAAIERAVLAESGVEEALFSRHRQLGKGTRRPLRLEVREARWDWNEADYLTVRFVLPKGGYATTVLGRVFRLVDPHAAPPPAHAGEP